MGLQGEERRLNKLPSPCTANTSPSTPAAHVPLHCPPAHTSPSTLAACAGPAAFYGGTQLGTELEEGKRADLQVGGVHCAAALLGFIFACSLASSHVDPAGLADLGLPTARCRAPLQGPELRAGSPLACPAHHPQVRCC